MKVYCTRPCYPDQKEPHSTEMANVDLLGMEKPRRDTMKCVTCGMPLILNGRYAPVKKLGQGGFGYTFLALDLKFGLDSKRVIKQFRSDLFLSAGQMALAKKAFEREYKIQDQLRHSQIPRVYEPFDVEVPSYGDINTNQSIYYYFVQEYIEGEDLQKKLKNRQQQSNSTFSEVEVQSILKQVLGILSDINSLPIPIIHRDIKPSNIIQASDGNCYLVDFGAVKQVLPMSDSSKQTTIMGTPGYAPSEQFDGIVDFSSDLYALAKTCICLLTGSSSSSPPWGTSDLLTKALTKMISLDPQMRYRSATEARKNLSSVDRPQLLLQLVLSYCKQNKWLFKATVGIFTALTVVVLVRYLHYISVRPTYITSMFNPRENRSFNDISTPDGTFYYGCSTAWVPLINEVKSTIKQTHGSFMLKSKADESPEKCNASKDGLVMLDNNQLEIGLSSKKSAVKSKNSTVMNRAMIAQSTIAMIVHKKSKVESVTEKEFRSIRDGEINDWRRVGGESSSITLYATHPEYTRRDKFVSVNSSEEGIREVSNNSNGVMIVPIQIAAKHCHEVKTLLIKKRNGDQLDPFQSECSDSGEAEVRTTIISNLLEEGLEEFILNFEIVFRTDREESEKAGKALVEILRSKRGEEMIKKVGYVPIKS